MDKLEISPKVNELDAANESLPFFREDIECSDEMRIYKAKKFGLPETATWEDVNEKEDKVYIAKLAVALGLPEDSTHKEVMQEEERRGIGPEAYLLSLGLTLDATREELEEAERKKEAEEMVILRKVAEDMRVNRAKNITPTDLLQ